MNSAMFIVIISLLLSLTTCSSYPYKDESSKETDRDQVHVYGYTPPRGFEERPKRELPMNVQPPDPTDKQINNLPPLGFEERPKRELPMNVQSSDPTINNRPPSGFEERPKRELPMNVQPPDPTEKQRNNVPPVELEERQKREILMNVLPTYQNKKIFHVED